jgi:hypothetical protein
VSQTDELAVLIDALRRVLKAKKIRYHHVAAHLGVSLATVKRLFAGEPCNIAKLMAICELAGISFFDLTALAAKPSEEAYRLNEEQERHFASYPGQHAIFRELARGRSPDDVRAEWGLDKRKLYRVLRQLEELKLLEVLPGNKVRMLAKGMIRMDEDGPFARTVLFQQNVDFLQHVQAHVREKEVCYHNVECALTPALVKDMVEEIHALGRKYRIQAQQAAKVGRAAELRNVRWLFAFAGYRTDWTSYRV